MPDGSPPRRRDAGLSRQMILDAALIEFSDNGLAGGRVDAIAARTGMNVRLIYYYFGSKDGLYQAVLERGYAEIRAAEQALSLDTLDPVIAIRRLVEFSFDYHEDNPRFTRLVTIENVHRAEHIARSPTIRDVNQSVIATIQTILSHGQATGMFRADATAATLHLLMTSFCFFRVANRHTLTTVLHLDPLAPELRDIQRRMIGDAVLGYLVTNN